MKLVKSLLIGSAAALAATGASAADLGAKKPTPVEYVRVCSAQGAGFFFIPGTDTCLRISGRVRAEYRFVEQFNRGANVTGFRARGVLNADARTQTDYGVVRTYISFLVNGDTGVYSGGASRSGADNTAFSLDKAFIQFAGITAGRAGSFFDFFPNNGIFGSIRVSDRGTQNVLAYTLAPGGGFTATIAIEDAYGANTGLNRNIATLVGATPVTLATINGNTAGIGTNLYGGARMPDVVANLRIEQAWGAAQLMGAVHQVHLNTREPAVLGTARFVDTKYGFAIGAGVRINLPMIAAGDNLIVQGAYSEGAPYYNGFGTGAGAGGLNAPIVDAIVTTTGAVKLTRVWSIGANFTHFWLPTLRSNFGVSYAQVDHRGLGNVAFGKTFDFNEWIAIGNLIWNPVRNMDIGVEVAYRNVDPRGVRIVSTNDGRLVGREDVWEARLRIQRDF
jgi:hypothetical protein